jgi:hypothetical protein
MSIVSHPTSVEKRDAEFAEVIQRTQRYCQMAPLPPFLAPQVLNVPRSGYDALPGAM